MIVNTRIGMLTVDLQKSSQRNCMLIWALKVAEEKKPTMELIIQLKLSGINFDN